MGLKPSRFFWEKDTFLTCCFNISLFELSKQIGSKNPKEDTSFSQNVTIFKQII